MKKIVRIFFLLFFLIIFDPGVKLLYFFTTPIGNVALAIGSILFSVYGHFYPRKTFSDLEKEEKINYIFEYITSMGRYGSSIVRSLINIQFANKHSNTDDVVSNIFKSAKIVLSAIASIKSFTTLKKHWENNDDIICLLLGDGKIFLAEQKLIKSVKIALENESIVKNKRIFNLSIAERLFTLSKISQCYGNIDGYRNSIRFCLEAYEAIDNKELLLKKKYLSCYIFALISVYEKFGEVTAIEHAIKKATDYSNGFDPYNDSYLWATAKMLCGVAYCVKGEKTGDINFIKSAIVNFNEASKFIKKDAFPEDWGAIQNNIGAALLLFGVHTIRSECLIRAATAFENAISVNDYTSLEEKEGAYVNLGNAYMEIGKLKETQKYLRKALAVFKMSLSITSIDDSPESYFAARLGLGEALRYIGEANGDEQWIDKSIAFMRNLLKQIDCKIYPVHYASLQNNLSIILQAKGRFHDDIQTYQRAYDLSSLAVMSISRCCMPVLLATFYNSKGNAAVAIARKNSDIKFIEIAIAAFTAGLDQTSKQTNPNLWGSINFGLSDAYRLFADINFSTECYMKAIDCMINNFLIFKREVDQFSWAKTCNDMAVTYRHLFSATNNFQYLVTSILFLKKSLQIYSKDETITDWEITKNNLAEALLELGRYGHYESTILAVIEYKELLLNLKSDFKIKNKTGIQHNLGYSLFILGSQIKSYHVLCESENILKSILSNNDNINVQQVETINSILKDIRSEIQYLIKHN